MAHEFTIKNGLSVDYSGDDKSIVIHNSSVSHGITDIAETDIFASLAKEDNSNGGLKVSGLTGNSRGLFLGSYAVNSYTGTLATSQGTTTISSFKKSGTGVTDFADNDNILAIRNNATTLAILKGVGDFYLRAGGLKVSNTTTAVSGMIRWSGSDFEGYNGSTWDSFTTGSGGTPGGSDGQIQYNNGGAFGGDTDLTWDDTNHYLTLGAAATLTTGGEAAPDVDAGGLCLNQGAGDGKILSFKSSDVSQPITLYHEADTYGFTQKLSATAGGLVVGALSSSNASLPAFQIDAAMTAAGTNYGYGVINLNVHEHDGSGGVQSIGSTENMVSFRNSGTINAVVKGDGSYWTKGSLVTGGETAPDVDAGGLCLNHGADDGNALTIKNSDISHPFTSLAETDTYGTFSKSSNTSGGLKITGYRGSGHVALNLSAYTDNPVDGELEWGAISLLSYKTDGSTGTASLGNMESLVAFANSSTIKAAIKGGGDFIIAGGLNINSYTGTASAGAIEWNGTNFRGYTGSVWKNLDAQAATPTPGGSDTQVQYNNGGALGGANGFVWDDVNARVGLGKTVPTKKLDVIGNAQFEYNSSADNFIITNGGSGTQPVNLLLQAYGNADSYIEMSGGYRWQLRATYSNSIFGLYKRHSGGSAYVLSAVPDGDSTARIGIKTDSPTERLDVNGAIRIRDTSIGTNDGTIRYTSSQFQFRQAGNWETLNSLGGVSTFLDLTDTPGTFDSGRILFQTSSAVTDDADLYWDNTNKRLGLGTTSPATVLDIVAEGGDMMYLTEYTSQGTQPGIRFRKASGTEAAPGNVTSGDYTGALIWHPRVGGTFTSSAAIRGYTSGTPGTRAPTRMDFMTADDTNLNNWLSIFSDGKISTGDELAPDCSPGGICLNIGTNSKLHLSMKHGNVAHPFTSVEQTDTLGSLSAISYANGGLSVRGWSEFNRGLFLGGFAVTPDTGITDSDSGVAGVNVYKSDGGTSVTVLGSNDNAFSVRNYNQLIFMLKGGGDLHLLDGGVAVTGWTGTAVSGAIQWDGSNFQGYDGASWVNLDGAAAVGGSDTQVQFNDGGSLGADANFTWDKTNDRLAVGQATATSTLDVAGDIEIGTSNWHYAGDPSTNGSWRWGLNGGASLIFQKRETGTWNTKHTLS